jgi:hypothetical protein
MNPRIHWSRIALAAALLELAITALVIPFGVIFGNPLSPSTNRPGASMLPYLLAAAAGCAVFGFLFGRWAARGTGGRSGLHGLLTGIVATLLYVAMGSVAPGGLTGLVTAYGAGWYVLFNVVRVAGCWIGGMAQPKPRTGTASPPAR